MCSYFNLQSSSTKSVSTMHQSAFSALNSAVKLTLELDNRRREQRKLSYGFLIGLLLIYCPIIGRSKPLVKLYRLTTRTWLYYLAGCLDKNHMNRITSLLVGRQFTNMYFICVFSSMPEGHLWIVPLKWLTCCLSPTSIKCFSTGPAFKIRCQKKSWFQGFYASSSLSFLVRIQKILAI